MHISRKRVRALARVLTAVALAATTVTAGAGVASAEEEDVPPVVTLQASNTTPPPDSWVELSASANEAELNTYLRIVDVNTGEIVANCFQSASCYGWAWGSTGSREFIAYVVVASTSLPTDIRSASNPVTVYWHRASLVTLTATPPTTLANRSVELDAVADDPFFTSYITIWDVTNPSAPALVEQCQGPTCSASVTRATAGSRDFVAHVSDSSWPYYWYYYGSSPTVRATWLAEPAGSSVASSLCDDGQQVVDSTTEGVRVKMYVEQPTADETHVCVRAEHVATGAGFGGQFVVTPTVPDADVTNVQTPSDDTQSGLCTTTTPNAVPGSHPITSGGIAGTPYMVDAYATTGQAWICLRAGTTHVRLKVPVAVPNVVVTPGTQVQFVPDPGTPDVL